MKLTHIDGSLAGVVRQQQAFECSSSICRDGPTNGAGVDYHLCVLLLEQWQEVLRDQEGANYICLQHSCVLLS